METMPQSVSNPLTTTATTLDGRNGFRAHHVFNCKQKRQSQCTTTLWSCHCHMQACTHNARLLCGVASLHSLYKFNERPVRNATRATLKDASVRNAMSATASYHQRFFWPSTSKRQAPRFSLRDPLHAGALSTHCSEKTT